ncbi:hypothetical protein ACFSCX_12460 [Bacillus salitolerans]|uniref:Lipoprotein n=1 Tax=Bacillus salitolerans TaxID=1437434 RepID=A0ABW4LTD7_9BACI
MFKILKIIAFVIILLVACEPKPDDVSSDIESKEDENKNGYIEGMPDHIYEDADEKEVLIAPEGTEKLITLEVVDNTEQLPKEKKLNNGKIYHLMCGEFLGTYCFYLPSHYSFMSVDLEDGFQFVDNNDIGLGFHSENYELKDIRNNNYTLAISKSGINIIEEDLLPYIEYIGSHQLLSLRTSSFYVEEHNLEVTILYTNVIEREEVVESLKTIIKVER